MTGVVPRVCVERLMPAPLLPEITLRASRSATTDDHVRHADEVPPLPLGAAAVPEGLRPM